MKELLHIVFNLTAKELQDAQQILRLTKQVKERIETKDVEELNKTIDLRQRWIKQAEETQEKVQTNIEDICKCFSIERIEEIDRNLYPSADEILKNKDETKAIYKNAFELEKQNQEKAERLLKEYKMRIKNLNQGKKAFHAYNKKSIGASILLNKVK